jgi:hypothetical protein
MLPNRRLNRAMKAANGGPQSGLMASPLYRIAISLKYRKDNKDRQGQLRKHMLNLLKQYRPKRSKRFPTRRRTCGSDISSQFGMSRRRSDHQDTSYLGVSRATDPSTTSRKAARSVQEREREATDRKDLSRRRNAFGRRNVVRGSEGGFPFAGWTQREAR